jgi:hypothetical protein
MRLSKSYNLKALYPQIAQQWHPKRNEDLTPEQVTPGSGKKVWWKCKKRHEWQAEIASRSGGIGCPYCAGKKVTKKQGSQSGYLKVKSCHYLAPMAMALFSFLSKCQAPSLFFFKRAGTETRPYNP